MANKFVWSGASGGNDGSTWEDAYVSLMRDWGAEAGFTPATDNVYVRSVHAESTGSTLTITGSTVEVTPPSVIRVICVVGDTTGTTPGNLATGASVTTTGANNVIITEGIYIYGVDFSSGNDINIASSGDGNVTLEQCSFAISGGGANDQLSFGTTNSVASQTRLFDCDLDLGQANHGISSVNCRVIWDGGTLITTNPTIMLEMQGVEPSYLEMQNMDLSVAANSLVDSTVSIAHHVKLSRCLLGTGVSILDGNIDIAGYVVETIHCQIGTDADPAFQLERATYEGTVKSVTASYRAGGFKDGERTNPISWDMDTTVGNARSWPGHALWSPPVAGWTDGDGSTEHTYRIYFASGGTQQDDDIWFDLTGPNDAATNSLGVRKTKRVPPEGTPANHTTDSGSTWTGADVGTKQYMEIAYTPDKPGPIHAIVHMATDAGAAGHIFVDPKIYIDP